MIYQPAEDSFLMSKILKQELPKLLNKNLNLKFFEIGAGSGIHLNIVRNIGIKLKNIFSSDINLEAVKYCNSLGFDCIQSDLFENIKGRYDIIIFNPPYLPEDFREPEDSRLETTGGKKGTEIILRFFQQAKKHLEKNGKIFLITSSLSPEINFEKLGYNAKEIGCYKLFMERLYIWELGLF